MVPPDPSPGRSAPADVAAFLAGLAPGERAVVEALRAAIRRAAPQAVETLLWGGLSWHRPAVGGRVKGAVCQVGVQRGRVRLDFIHGVRLSDPSGLLRGERVSKRHVPIASVADAARPEVRRLIEEAASIEWP